MTCIPTPMQAGVANTVASFMLQDLRRFQMYDSSATRPYTVSAIANYKRAAHLGYITLDQAGKARARGKKSRCICVWKKSMEGFDKNCQCTILHLCFRPGLLAPWNFCIPSFLPSVAFTGWVPKSVVLVGCRPQC